MMDLKGRRQEKEAYEDCLKHCLSIAQPSGQLAVHHQPITLLPQLCLSLNAFIKSILPWVHFQNEWPQWELSTSPAPHQCQPKHRTLLVTRRQKMALLASRVLQFHNTSGSHLSIRHAGKSRKPPPLQMDEKQLRLFSHWCIRFYERVCMRVCESVCVCMHIMWLFIHPSLITVPTSHWEVHLNHRLCLKHYLHALKCGSKEITSLHFQSILPSIILNNVFLLTWETQNKAI